MKITRNKNTMINIIKKFQNKEVFIAAYLLLFILGIHIGFMPSFYNDYRLLEILLLLGLGLYSFFDKQYFLSKTEVFFFIFILIGYFLWDNSDFVIIELLLAYLLYKAFYFLKYDVLLTKLIVLASFLNFILLPISLAKYMTTGIYNDWHPLPWNIRVYSSYFLIVSIFAVWFYITENKYRAIYLLFMFLAFFSILLEGGRSATIAFTAFMIMVCGFNSAVRWKLILTYASSWLSYLFITYFASLNTIHSNFDLLRRTSSSRYELWMNAYRCWLQNPFFGCGFYQLDDPNRLNAHPHNLFLQVLSEVGLIGISFLAFIIFTILKNIKWKSQNSYFVFAVLLAVGIDVSFSGIHIYPVTQIALLWLFVFLLKNPAFSHHQYFSNKGNESTSTQFYTSIIVYSILTFIFGYLLLNSSVMTEAGVFGRPRFWENGYTLW